jgi:arylsulfatase
VVDRSYEHKAPYPFTGTVKHVVFDLQPLPLAQQQALHEHQLSHTVGHGASG